MRPRDILWLSFCAIGGAALVYLLRVALGGWPNLALVGGILIIAIGLGLVGARFSRLGPFDGELGAPWFENDLRETLAWEHDRAARYGRIVAVIVMQHRPNAPDWDAVVRAVDRVIDCRNGWMIMILPETTRDGALSMLRRLNESGAVLQSTVLQLPADVVSRDDLPGAITDAIRARAPHGAGAMAHALSVEPSTVAR